MNIPLRCEAIKIQAACQIKITKPGGSKAECGWNGNKCINKDCSTAPQSLDNDSLCDQYMSGCVVKYVKVDQIFITNGCQELSKNCQFRYDAQQCIIQRIGYPQCVWDPSGNICLIKSCLTANIPNSSGALTEFNMSQCDSYLTGCIQNANQDGCINQPQLCVQLSSNNCFKSQEGICYLNNDRCLLKICSNINQNTHEGCFNSLETCTVNKVLTGCETLAEQCHTYVNQEQCKITITGNHCIWQSFYCRERECYDAPQISLYNSHINCQNFLQKCTVIKAVNGCETQEFQCSAYQSEQRCNRTFNQSEQNCIWINNQCYDKRELESIQCSYLKGTQQICRQYKLGCTNHDWADVQDECYFDCNEINLAGLSFQQCQAKSLTCSVNITGTKCVLLENSCDLYYQQESCFVTQYQRCFFENGFCYPLTSGDDCYKLQGPYSDEICSTKNNFCIANISGTSCIKREYSCQFYSTIENCTRDYSKRCLMINGLCTSIIDPFNECQYIQGNPGSFDHEYCQSFHSSCTGTNNKEQCYYIPQKCEDNNYNPNYCNHSVSGKCYYFYYTDICFSTQDPDLNCNQIIGAGLNFQFCQQYNSKCSVNSSGTHCIQGKNYCNYYTTFDECNQSFTENCIYILINQQTICLGQNQYFDCRMIYFEDNIYNHFRCNQKSERCTSENSTSCTEKTCQNYLGTEFNHQSCYTWNSKCTVSASSVKCELMLPNCTNNKVESCIRSLEGNCEVINNRCQFRNCSNAPQHFFTHAQCYAYQNQCTVAKEGGCIEKSISCNQFSQIQCFSTSSNSNCFWNPIKQNCVQANCDSIEETEAFDSHLKCFYALGLNNACTVRSLNGVLVPGCMMLTDCKNYEIQQQCVIGINYIQCEWIDRLTPPQCMDKSCFTASRNINTHLDCNAYFPNCTVSRFKDPNTNEFIIGGCQETLMCESYEFEIQCIVDTLNNACQWTGTQCLTKSCETAPISDSYSSNQQCMDYFGEDCVVSNSGQGCMTIKMTCEEMLLQDQCYKSKQGQLCIWDSNNMKCLPNSCSNIEKINNLQCSQLNSKCDQLDQQCRRLICEDLKYSTDFECEFHMKGCTTNGYHCVKRGSCLQVLHLNGCVKSNLGELCVWIKEDDYGYCDLAECSTAPISYKSDIQCKSHKTSCTVKKQGGCKSITTCENFEKQEACMMDINGNNCIWENEICRNFDCQDYRGFAFQYCQDFNTNCTIGKNGYCTQMLNCNQYKLKSMCYKGLDGLCKWIQDGSEQEGICMLFDQCQSLIFNTDTKCKLASKLCTTDGFKCVPLTSCNQTNVNGGCVQGTDGECIVYLDQQSQKHACKLFQTCSDAKFITHFDCQFANKKCTSNGVNCIEISSCNLYTKPESCVIDQNQQHCYWDSNSTCRDKVCKDYIIKEECIYNSCLWIQDKCESQKQKTCSDFLTQEECDITRDELDCIYNGFACVKNQNINCSSFLTRDTCYNHKNLKVCYWQDQKCQLFNRCSDADSNQEVCYKYPKNCIYSNNLCKTIDCSQYYIMNGNCQRIYNLENNIIKFCQLQNGSCAEIDPTTLSEMSCFSQSGQTFLWNTKIQKCESCLKVTSINNGSHNSTQIIEDMQSQLLSSILMNIILLSIY